MQQLTITLQLFVDLPRKTKKAKRVYLSRNAFDNLHYHVKNQVKTAIHELVLPQVHSACISRLNSPVCVRMTLFPGRATCDLGNFCDVVSKIAQDAVVRSGVIEDDSVKYIKSEHRVYGGTDPVNPRITIAYEGTQK